MEALACRRQTRQALRPSPCIDGSNHTSRTTSRRHGVSNTVTTREAESFRKRSRARRGLEPVCAVRVWALYNGAGCLIMGKGLILWMLGVPGIVVIALLLTHVI